MRRMLVTSFALAGDRRDARRRAGRGRFQDVAPDAHETGRRLVGSTHKIFVDTTWTPKRFETRVTVKISVNGEPLRTLRVKHWVIGHKLFKLTVPDSVAEGSKARIEVRVHSEAGDDQRSVLLALP